MTRVARALVVRNVQVIHGIHFYKFCGSKMVNLWLDVTSFPVSQPIRGHTFLISSVLKGLGTV